MERKAMVETRIQVDDRDSLKCGTDCGNWKLNNSDRLYVCKLFNHRLVGTNLRCQECLEHFGL